MLPLGRFAAASRSLFAAPLMRSIAAARRAPVVPNAFTATTNNVSSSRLYSSLRGGLASRLAVPRLPVPQQLHLVRRLTTSAADATIAAGGAEARNSSNNSARNRRTIGLWLATTAGAVFVMVVIGGVTRLTKSGLSIVEWGGAVNETWPGSAQEWEAEFEKYKAFPEWGRVNRGMTLDEFKFIYFMEWFHRQWGRGIGLLFGLPLGYFALTKRIPSGMGPKLALLLALGAGQGAVGWWMVKSGLEHERFNAPGMEYAIPRVSAYRLATHLMCAFTLYSALTWISLDCLRPPAAATQALSAGMKAASRALRPYVLASTGLIFVTAYSGAFVASNDAGHAYNDWPLFAGRLIPEEIWYPHLGLRNLFENTATVQFDHRNLAYASLLSVGAVHWKMGRLGGHAALPPSVRSASRTLGLLVGAQVLLGISTLVMYVPVPLAAAHQAGALALLTGAINMLHAIGHAQKAPTLAAGEADVSAAASAAMRTGGRHALMSLGALGLLGGGLHYYAKHRDDGDE